MKSSVGSSSTTLAAGLQTTVLRRSVASFREVCIHSDSKAVVPDLNLLTAHSKLVKKYMASLVIKSIFFRIKLVWVSGLSGFARNCKADDLAREGTLTHPISFNRNRAGTPLSFCVLSLDL